MDNLRGYFDGAEAGDPYDYLSGGEDEYSAEPPPSPVGQDDRRMQVRAYNHWAGSLGDRSFPSIEDLDPANLPDFGPWSVLLDFTNGIDNPSIRYLGATLAGECGIAQPIGQLSEVPSRSLLSRITDHYMQILANQAPIGFEAEFVNQRGATILYRGILLPYSSDDDTIDFIYGVINWKEVADQLTSDELLLEIDQALGLQVDGDAGEADETLADWADGPLAEPAPLAMELPPAVDHAGIPLPAFGLAPVDAEDSDFGEGEGENDHDEFNLYDAIEAEGDSPETERRFASLLSLGGGKVGGETIVEDDADGEFPDFAERFDDDGETGEESGRAIVPVFDHAIVTRMGSDHAEPAGLHDCLAEARELALAARSCEDRSRGALYAAVGRAYDVSLAAAAEPAEYTELMADAGLTAQDRAPMTPVVKLVFGADYDKTRLTEYATVLTYAHRARIAPGKLAEFLARADGGLKGVVQHERRLRRQAADIAAQRETPREELARKLRAIAPLGFEDVATDGEEFALVMIRRDAGQVIVLGEIADLALVEKAGRKLVA